MCLGDTYFFQESDRKMALQYYKQSLKISKEVKNKKNIARSYYSIAAVHWSNNNIPLSRSYCEKSLNIFIKLNLEIQATAETVAFSEKKFSELLVLAHKGVQEINIIQKNLFS